MSALVAYVQRRGYPPTLRELARATGCSVRTVCVALEFLEARGLIERVPGVARGIRLLEV